MRKVLKCETERYYWPSKYSTSAIRNCHTSPPSLFTSPTTPQISQGWLQNLCKRYAVCHAYASRESSSHDAAHSICLTRDLNQLKIDLWIFLVYATRGGRRRVTLKRLLRCCVACQVQISKIDWNSTCSMRGVLVKPLENYSFQFSARIVINFRKTYIYRFHKVAIHAQLSSAKALTLSFSLFLSCWHAHPLGAATSKGR